MTLMPVFLAWTAKEPLPQASVDRRLQTIGRFLHLDAEEPYAVQFLTDGHCGLAFFEYRHNPFAIPLRCRTADRLSVSAYLPFGASRLVGRQALTEGGYMSELLDQIAKSPETIQALAPPQIFCRLDRQTHLLTLCNDWRGFGRLHEYKTTFGTVWSNKMAAALIFAGLPARLDESALADLAACGMFSGSGTGYQNLHRAAPGTLIEVDALSGKAVSRYLSSAACGLTRSEPQPDAVEKAHAAIAAWMRELALFSHGRLRLNLSGGRDSRVVGAALLAAGLDCEMALCSPPAKDAELAKRLLNLAGMATAVQEQARRAAIEQWYATHGDLLDIADTFLRNTNSDISVKLFFSWPTAISDAAAGPLKICGDQGEVAHNCYYTCKMFEEEKTWLSTRLGIRPSTKRFHGLVDTISVKSFGVTAFCGRQAAENIKRNVLTRAEALGLDGFYRLDFLCLHLNLNRQWPGANGAFDRKTPLTVHPYAQNGFTQSIEAKLNSRFVRDVVASFLPAWRDVPFFHELPKKETEDFYLAYPTYWEMKRGEELLEICGANSGAWQFFDRKGVVDTFKAMMDKDYYQSLAHPKTSTINTTAQKLIWLMTMERNLNQINQACAAAFN